MGDVIQIHSKRIFSEEDAIAILPIIKKITYKAYDKVEEIKEQIEFVPPEEPLHNRLKMQLGIAVKGWAIKMTSLGCDPKGLWSVDFNAGEGAFSWRLGEDNINFFHSRVVRNAQTTQPELLS